MIPVFYLYICLNQRRGFLRPLNLFVGRSRYRGKQQHPPIAEKNY
jgi:hypothetical protein